MATFAPHVERAVLEINKRFTALGDGTTYPGHGEDGSQYAADFWSTDKAVHDRVLRFVIDNHKRLGVKYIISWVRIWSDARSSEGVRHYSRYDGVNANASQLHKNHVHISFNVQPPAEEDDDMPVSDDDAIKIADQVAKRDGNIRNKDSSGNIIFDPNAGDYISLANAVYQMGLDLRTLKDKLS